MCVTDSHDMTLAVKVALNPNTTNQPASKLGTFPRELGEKDLGQVSHKLFWHEKLPSLLAH